MIHIRHGSPVRTSMDELNPLLGLHLDVSCLDGAFSFSIEVLPNSGGYCWTLRQRQTLFGGDPEELIDAIRLCNRLVRSLNLYWALNIGHGKGILA